MIITSGDLINSALRKCGGILAEGETPSAELSADSLMALNVMLDSWSAESLSVFSSQDQMFTWPASAASRTLGPTGDFVGNRPVNVEDSCYFKLLGSQISSPLTLINQAQYNGIGDKTTTSSLPSLLWANMTSPNIELHLYPVPTEDLEFHITSSIVLSPIPDLFTEITLPPGYQRAIIYNLACEIASEFGMEPPGTAQRIAMTSKRVLKAQNSSMDVMSMPAGLNR